MANAIAKVLAVGCWLGLSLVSAAAQQPMRLLLGETRAIDKGVGSTKVEPPAFTSALRFILGTDPALQVGELSDASAGTALDAYQLTSTLQTLRDSVLWAGELRRGGQDAGTKPFPPILVGPVVLADEKGLKASALVEIAALIKRHLSQQLTATSKSVSIYSCLRPDQSNAAKQIAEEFRIFFAKTLSADARAVSAVDLIPLQPPPPCDVTAGPLPENAARVVGTVTQRDQSLSIEPLLEWKDYAIPLPIFTDDANTVQKLGPAYGRMLSRATVAAFRQYPPRIAEFLENQNKTNWQEDSRSLFSFREFPYLLAAALQRRNSVSPVRAENEFELGLAFAIAKEPEFAASAFEKALQLKPGWVDAYRELGGVLLELQRYDEAEAALKKALDQGNDPVLLEKYAQVVFFLGKRDLAGEVLDDVFKTTGGTFQARLLAARIALDQNKLDTALRHIGTASNLPGADQVVITRFARDIANAALDNTLENQQLESAAAALNMIPETKDDVQLFALKGSVQLRQALRSDGKTPAGREFASKNISGALEYYRKVLAADSADPDYEAIELDISEGLYFAASYEVDPARKVAFLSESAKTARSFLKKDDPRGLGLVSYRPVAQLLITTAEYLQAPGKDPRPEFEHQLSETAAASDGPHLSVTVPTGKDTKTNIKVGQWSFEAFDWSACKILPSPESEVVHTLSDQTQKKFNPKRGAKAC